MSRVLWIFPEYTTLVEMRRKMPFHLATDLPKTVTFKPKQGRHYALCRVPCSVTTVHDAVVLRGEKDSN